MELIDEKLMNQEIQMLLKNKVEMQCFMCMGEFDCDQYAPMIMCMNQHSCCAPCMQELLKTDSSKSLTCPHCNQPIIRKSVTKNRLLMTTYEVINAFKSYIATLQSELESLRKLTSIDSKVSLLSKNPKLVSSFILKPDRSSKILQKSMLFDDYPTTRSQTWVGGAQKRRQILLSYAQRQKVQQLKKIAKSDIPLQQITTIRSGYGTIKKIECMQYFINLRELLLYNNHIRTIEGLNSNIKLNVLSLAYNKIEKVENIGHLKELKRLSLQCNKIGKSSAEYIALYQWKNLQSLTISFHQEKKQDTEECFNILFGNSSIVQWGSLKTLYIYSSKGLGEKIKSTVKQFATKKKNPLQIYWS